MDCVYDSGDEQNPENIVDDDSSGAGSIGTPGVRGSRFSISAAAWRETA